MRRVALGLIVGALVIGTLSGCRAMSKGGGPPPPEPTPSATSTPPPPAPETKPPPPPTPPPAAQANPIEFKDISDIFVLREALGQHMLPLIDGKLLTLEKVAAKGPNTPNILLEGGKLKLSQTLPGEGGGQGTVSATGNYQKLGTTSGDSAIFAKPTTIDFNFKCLQIKSPCYGTLSVTGNVRCTLNATYTYGTHTLIGSGQCMTHTNGTLDNLRVDIGNSPRKARYNLGFKVNGDPTDWKSYQWTGIAYVGGIKVDLTQVNNPENVCNK